jgi:hypothetical protein
MRLLVAAALLVPTLSWLQPSRPFSALHHHKHQKTRTTTSLESSSSLSSSSSPADTDTPDYTGKTIYQRTFYRLFGSSLPIPHALVLEERLRFQADPENPGYILPMGLRTFIFRKGTAEDEITDELYRLDLGPNNGPGTMDTDIATVLYLAANPDIVQGNVLQLSCESGAAGILGCIAARLAKDQSTGSSSSSSSSSSDDDDDGDETILTVPHREKNKVFPPRMRHLTLSEEGQENLRLAADVVKDFEHGDNKVSLKDTPWSVRIPNRRYQYYRTILGSDIDISYPSARELARFTANSLLPSDPAMLSALESSSSSSSSSGSSSSSSSSASFGGLGMDMPPSSTATTEDSSSQPETDPRFPPTFVHVCPDAREDTRYVRQFLENGYKMTVDSDYLRLERLQFVFQTLEADTADEADLEDLDLELKGETERSYQCLTAVHHPDYTGEGSGEYFFPMETGEYEGGGRTTYLEPEEEGSPWK